MSKSLAFGASLLVILLTLFGIIGLNSYQSSVETPIVAETVSGGTIDLSLFASRAYLLPQQETNLTLRISSTSRVTGVTVELDYNPATVQVISVTQGDFLSNVLSSPKIQNGKVSFTYAAPPDSGGVESSGTLATIKIKPFVYGDFTLEFSPNTVAYGIDPASSQAIPGNTLRSLTNQHPPVRSPADFNLDAVINLADYNFFVGAYGTAQPPVAGPADINEDGHVNLADYNLFVPEYGKTY